MEALSNLPVVTQVAVVVMTGLVVVAFMWFGTGH